MILDRPDREKQPRRDLAIRKSTSDQERDLALAWRELREQRPPSIGREDANHEAGASAVVFDVHANVGIRPERTSELGELVIGERRSLTFASGFHGIAQTAQGVLVDVRCRGGSVGSLHARRMVGSIVGPALMVASLLSGAARHASAQSLETPSAKRVVIDSLASLLRAQYVDADTGALIAAHIGARQRAGAYDTLPPKEFAAQVTRDLRATNGDRHLSLVLRDVAPGANPGPSLSGPFLGRVEMLPGQIGLFSIHVMPFPTPENLRAVDEAMSSLQQARAVVVDLRGNHGGAGPMTDYLWGFFTQPDSVPTMQMLTRGTGRTVQRWVKRSDKPGPPRDVPLYLLIDSGTGSAAEGFAFFLQQSGRATVIGEHSAGAGHGVAFFPVAPGVVAGISITRVWYPPTGKEWERTGVIPNVVAPSAGALDTAVALVSRSRAEHRSTH